MDDKKYYLAIVNEGKKDNHIYGYLSGTSFDDELIRFDPLTVFGELLSTAIDYEKINSPEPIIWTNSFRESYHQHPFFQGEDIKRKIELCQYKALYPHKNIDNSADLMNELASLLSIGERLHDCFEQGNSISMNELELIKSLNQFTFTFEVEERHENPYYRDGGTFYDDWAKKTGGLDFIKGEGHDINSEFVYYGVYFNAHVTFEIWQGYLEEAENPIRFAYTCYSLEEAFFALWHYLIFNGYTKFNQCHHCGTYFATKSLKHKYCTQNSPYEKYEHLDCEQAVRNIKQKLARRRKVIYTHLNNYYSEDTRRQFERKCDLHEDKIKALSSVENLKAYERSLDKQAVKEKWYTVENKKKARTAE